MGKVTTGPDGTPRIEAGGKPDQPFVVSAYPPGELLTRLEENTSVAGLMMVAFGLLALALGVAGAMLPDGLLA
jgi:hypothetical protein